MGERGFSSTIAGSPGEALLSDPSDKHPEMGYLRVAARRTEADADRTKSAIGRSGCAPRRNTP
jgi:hypothetical protein